MKEGRGCKELGVNILSKQVKEGLVEKVKSEQIPKGIERLSHVEIQAKDISSLISLMGGTSRPSGCQDPSSRH